MPSSPRSFKRKRRTIGTFVAYGISFVIFLVSWGTNRSGPIGHIYLNKSVYFLNAVISEKFQTQAQDHRFV